MYSLRLQSALLGDVVINEALNFCFGMLVCNLWQAHKKLRHILSGPKMSSNQKMDFVSTYTFISTHFRDKHA